VRERGRKREVKKTGRKEESMERAEQKTKQYV
jgi:hypothetical protein